MNNPNLELGKEAGAILAEVVGGNASSITGAMEVFWQAADLLVANLNGISLNGVPILNMGSLCALFAQEAGESKKWYEGALSC